MSSLDFYDPNTFCLFDELPSEVSQHLVLSYLDLSYAFTVFCVCKRWLSYRNDRLLKELVYFRFNLPEAFQKPQDKDWKWVALSKMPFTAEAFNGVGTSTFSDGVYEGEFLNGTMSGIGTFQWKDAVYFGEWEEGLCNGYGVMVWTSGHKYEGYWKAGNQQGTGVFHFSNNDKYGGEWEKGRRHGQGKFNWANGDSYDGEWKEGYREGHGTFVWANGDSYVGEWSLGSRQGTGTLRWANGERYEGEWKNDDRTGQGSFYWSNGDIYKGSWSDSVQEGEGQLVWGNGNSFKGVWNKGNKYDGVLFEKPTSRRFRRIQDENNLEVKDEFVNPSVVKALKKNICSFEVTEQQCYFQYLYKTKDNDERTHGVCLACYRSCVPRNGTILFSGKMFFGGNFYCDCGAGNLDSPCWCKTNRHK